MTNRKMREMENRIRQAMEEPYEPTDERIEEIKQRAFEEYQRYVNAHEQANEKKEKCAQRKRSILRRVVVVAAVAVCFFVLSIVYIALQPSITANADGFFHRAVIWINDQLHLGIVINNPVEEDNLAQADHQSFSSIQELKDAGYWPIICLSENEGLVVDEVELSQVSQVFQQVTIHYTVKDKESISIRLNPLYEINNIIIDKEKTKAIETSIGEIYVWSDTIYSYATCITNECKITISSSLSAESLELYCNLLTYY